MHYTIHYPAGDPAATDLKALCDARDYMGEEYWSRVWSQFIQPGATMAATPYSIKKKTINAINFACMMAGIQGRPVGAIKRAIWAAHKGAE